MNILVLVSPGAAPSFKKWRQMLIYFALDDTPGGVQQTVSATSSARYKRVCIVSFCY
jgi:hypothetical protein